MKLGCKRFTAVYAVLKVSRLLKHRHTNYTLYICIHITIDDWWHGEDDPVPVIDNRINRFVFYD